MLQRCHGAPVPVTVGAGGATRTVTGDGTLELAGGGSVTIARGLAGAQTRVRVR